MRWSSACRSCAAGSKTERERPASPARSRSNTTISPGSRRHYVMAPEFARVSCGALTGNDVDRAVELAGWVHRRRDHGGLIFIDLRDRDGITQITFDPADAETFKLAESLRSEFVVRARGVVRRRPDGTENAKLPTGAIEVPVSTLSLISRS